MSLEMFIIFTYCMIDKELKNIIQEKGGRLRQRGPHAALTDAEALTIGIVGECLGLPSARKIWQYFKEHWRHYFPTIPTRCNFTRQLANLAAVKRKLFHRLNQASINDPHMVFIVDGCPIPLCELCRAGRCRRFPLDAAKGYCATKKMYYFGLKGHFVIDDTGNIIAYSIASPKEDERTVFANDCAEMVQNHAGVADKGYIGNEFHNNLLKNYNIRLSTPLRKNMKDYNENTFPHWMKDFRRKIETVIGHLVEQFNLTKIRSYNPYQFMSRMLQKVLAYNVARKWLNFNQIHSLNLSQLY